jgi:hypothetical protein
MPNGELANRFQPKVKPEEIAPVIETELEKLPADGPPSN